MSRVTLPTHTHTHIYIYDLHFLLMSFDLNKNASSYYSYVMMLIYHINLLCMDDEIPWIKSILIGGFHWHAYGRN